MSAAGDCAPPEITAVAVAVKGRGDCLGGNGSRRAVRWAAENLMPSADRFVLIHVIPAITSIPTPCNRLLLSYYVKYVYIFVLMHMNVYIDSIVVFVLQLFDELEHKCILFASTEEQEMEQLTFKC